LEDAINSNDNVVSHPINC